MPAAYLKAPDAYPTANVPFWCVGKEAFSSAVYAYAAAKRRRDKIREHYRCPTCGLFHVGTIGSLTAPEVTR